MKARIKQLESENKKLKQESGKKEESQYFGLDGQFNGVEPALKAYLPPKVYECVRQIFYGSKVEEPQISKEALTMAERHNFEIKKYSIPALKEQLRKERRVTVGAIQNRIVKPTDEPVSVQKKAIIDRIVQMIHAAAAEKANIVCMQEIWNAPFFMCTRERYPWVEFAEPIQG